jgi:hypothetical protein
MGKFSIVDGTKGCQSIQAFKSFVGSAKVELCFMRVVGGIGHVP